MKIKRYHQWIANLLALVTAINYFDRQNFPGGISEMKKMILIFDSQFGIFNSVFLLSYGAMLLNIVVGILVENIGYTLAFFVSGIIHHVSFILIITHKIEPFSLTNYIHSAKQITN